MVRTFTPKGERTTMREFIKKHSVIIYFILTCVISWLCILPIIGIDGFLGKAELSNDLIPILILLMCVGPLVSSMVMVYICDGKAGFKTLFRKLLIWKVHVTNYLIAIFVAPILTLLSSLILSFVSPKFLPIIFSSDQVLMTVIGGIIGALVAGFFEELGWTGFATPKLRAKYSILKTGLIIGIVWGIWHFPLFIRQDPTMQFPFMIVLLSQLITHLPPFRILMTWVYDRTQSLLIAVIMHMSVTASALIFLTDCKGIDIMIYALLYSFFLYLTLIIINQVTKGQIVKQNLKN